MKRESRTEEFSLVWRKSSYSGVNNGDCVEVAAGLPGRVPVRDSKVTEGPILTVGVTGWKQFVSALSHDALTR
jgi:hypothetical protein